MSNFHPGCLRRQRQHQPAPAPAPAQGRVTGWQAGQARVPMIFPRVSVEPQLCAILLDSICTVFPEPPNCSGRSFASADRSAASRWLEHM